MVRAAVWCTVGRAFDSRPKGWAPHSLWIKKNLVTCGHLMTARHPSASGLGPSRGSTAEAMDRAWPKNILGRMFVFGAPPKKRITWGQTEVGWGPTEVSGLSKGDGASCLHSVTASPSHLPPAPLRSSLGLPRPGAGDSSPREGVPRGGLHLPNVKRLVSRSRVPAV